MKVGTQPRKVLPVMVVIVKIVERRQIRMMIAKVPNLLLDNGRYRDEEFAGLAHKASRRARRCFSRYMIF